MYNLVSMARRIFIFIVGIFLCSMGIALQTQPSLGTTPISSLPYVLSLVCTLSFGTTTFLVNIVFIFLQVLMLRKNFHKSYYWQIGVTLIFGIFVDLSMHILSFVVARDYITQLVMLILGAMVMGLGIFLEVRADVCYVPGEGLVKAISKKFKLNFGKTKISFDIMLCVLAGFLSLLEFHSIYGLREGTIISALLVGNFVRLYQKIWIKDKIYEH